MRYQFELSQALLDNPYQGPLPLNNLHQYKLPSCTALSVCTSLLLNPMYVHFPAAKPAAVCPPLEDSACQEHPPKHLHGCYPPAWGYYCLQASVGWLSLT